MTSLRILVVINLGGVELLSAIPSPMKRRRRVVFSQCIEKLATILFELLQRAD